MSKPKFKIGDIVKVDLAVDWYSGYVVEHEIYQKDKIMYKVVIFIDNDLMCNVSEEWITLLEE